MKVKIHCRVTRKFDFSKILTHFNYIIITLRAYDELIYPIIFISLTTTMMYNYAKNVKI